MATTASQLQQLRLHLYLHHVGEPDPNTRDQITVVSPNGTQGFGAVVINDWAVHEGPSITSKIIARAQGHVVQCRKTGGQWYSSFSLVFEDGRYKGSSLQVMGMTVEWGEWAIVGGTGNLTLAQGVIRKAYQPNTGLIELDIYAVYRNVDNSMDGAWPWGDIPRVSPEQLQLHLYLRHIGEPDPNTRDQITVVSPNGTQGFGAVVINDWAVHEGPSVSSKIVARAQGHVVQCRKTGGQWYSSFSLVFEDGRYKGSSLQVMGMTVEKGEWAIVGGTGKLTLAQGVIRKAYKPDIGLIELDIHAIYNDIVNNSKDGA